MEKFRVKVKFSDRNRPGYRLGKIVTIIAEDETQARARGGVRAIFEEAHAHYGW